MPSGPDGLVADPRYTEEFSRARGLLLAHPGRWRVIYHYDGDGIASASSMLRALERLGYPAHATPLLGVERERLAALLRSTPGPVLVVDTGASWLDVFAAHRHPVIILDHHQYPGAPTPPPLPPHVAFVDPLDWGVDGMRELCAATLTWLYTIFLDPVNWDNAAWGLSGAIADRQHVGGFRGLNATLLEGARERSFLVRKPGLALFGPTLEGALRSSIDPYFRGLSARADAVHDLLRGLGLVPSLSPTALDDPATTRLREALHERLEHQGVAPELIASFESPRWIVPSLGRDAEEIANLQNASGRVGAPGWGVGIALGDPRALDRAEAAEGEWRTGILRELRRLEDEGVNSMSALQWFESPDVTLAGTQAGLAMNYLLDPTRPTFVFSASGSSAKISARGTQALIARGLDLSTVVRESAAHVGGEGGGHRIASGATIPRGREAEFRAEADRRLSDQLTPAGGAR